MGGHKPPGPCGSHPFSRQPVSPEGSRPFKWAWHVPLIALGIPRAFPLPVSVLAWLLSVPSGAWAQLPTVPTLVPQVASLEHSSPTPGQLPV